MWLFVIDKFDLVNDGMESEQIGKFGHLTGYQLLTRGRNHLHIHIVEYSELLLHSYVIFIRLRSVIPVVRTPSGPPS